MTSRSRTRSSHCRRTGPPPQSNPTSTKLLASLVPRTKSESGTVAAAMQPQQGSPASTRFLALLPGKVLQRLRRRRVVCTPLGRSRVCQPYKTHPAERHRGSPSRVSEQIYGAQRPRTVKVRPQERQHRRTVTSDIPGYCPVADVDENGVLRTASGHRIAPPDRREHLEALDPTLLHHGVRPTCHLSSRSRPSTRSRTP